VRAKRRRPASPPASCPSRKSTSALRSPTTSAWRPSPTSASMRCSGIASRSSASGGDLRLADGSYGEFGQRRSRPHAKRGAERPLPLGDRPHALERRQRLIAADCEHPRMVGALLHDDAGALPALHDRCRRRPGHDATGHIGGRPVAAVVRDQGTLRSAVRGVASLVAVNGPGMAPRAATGQRGGL
jgi:hypothetical protein